MSHIAPEFVAAVEQARVPVAVEAQGITRLAYDVSGIPGANQLPIALVTLLENVVRRVEDHDRCIEQAYAIVSAGLAGKQGDEIEFMPARVLFQDFTGVPVFVDFAAMRDAMVERGGDPSLVNPRIPCTLVIDHSVIADCAGFDGCAEKNERLEARRNRERFAFLKWSSQSFDNVEIVPPSVGICHQLNIERFCNVVTSDALSSEDVACFDTLVGTDSHTTTANGVGVLGWGVGGIEAEAAALGQPISMLVPPVVELRFEGTLPKNASGMDLALTVCELLRKEGVVGTLVEVTGPGVASLSATQRAAVANMTPEYGSTTTLFPADDVTMEYLALTGRDEDELAFAKAYLACEGVWGNTAGRTYARTIKLDLATIETCLAGPSRPHNRVTPAGLRERFRAVAVEHGRDLADTFAVTCGDDTFELKHGALAIAAITSCTTATDPAMMVAAGLLAQKAVEKGLTPKPWVKTILAPGSRATELLLKRANLTDSLFRLGFFTCGFGCMSCIGNSGEVHPALHAIAHDADLTSVLSGNRNFDGRISPDVAQNYLCQPALVVAYSLVGTMDADLEHEPVGIGTDGQPVFLRDLMPTGDEVEKVLQEVLTNELFTTSRLEGAEGSSSWQDIPTSSSPTFPWDEESTYVRRAPYFDLAVEQDVIDVKGARPLALLGDFVTTDHISPAGSIASTSPAARYLREHGV
ncbi:MAG: aconitate hydratase AcnA, partial [Atopobiaceae bacterium]|nr:aconitate hydratase AcnA [Atopobiaceae bacterium]